MRPPSPSAGGLPPPGGDTYGAYLDRVLVGGQEPRVVVISDYDPAWPERYQREVTRLRDALGGRVRSIDHIGSTAVPGLGAKDVVDICLVVDDAHDEAAYRAEIEALGYELRVTEPGHRAFRSPARDVNLHIYGAESPEREKYLLLRDHLRHSPEDRRAYEDLKRRLAAQQEWDDVNYYAEAKGGLIAEMLERAAPPPSPPQG